MHKAFRLPVPYVTQKSVYQEEFLTISEFIKAIHADHVKIKNKKFRAGKNGRGRLLFTLADDPKNISRPIYISFKGVSSYGVTKFVNYTGDVKVDEQDDKEEKKKKKSSGSWSIAFSTEENPKLANLADHLDNLVQQSVKPHLEKIYEELCNWDDSQDTPATIYRKSARGSSTSPSKFLRLTIIPGKTEFGPQGKFEKIESLAEFMQDTPGPYNVVLQLSHLDVTQKDGVVTIGAVLYAKVVRPAFEVNLKKRKFRDDQENE